MASAPATRSSAATTWSPQPEPERSRVGLALTILEPAERWRLEEEDVPETPLHDGIIQTLLLILKHWAHKEARSALVTSNLACRWDPGDARLGTDPDVVLVEPAPPEGEQLASLRIWEVGHSPPRVAIEVVSPSTAEKDYLDAAARCARLGVRELWVFDPLLVGQTDAGGPYLLQIWRRSREGTSFNRVHAGGAPTRTEALDAYLVVTDNGSHLRLANDPAGLDLWQTAEEAERARADEERARADRERVRADEERARADEERARADEERARAETAEAELTRLRQLLEERN